MLKCCSSIILETTRYKCTTALFKRKIKQWNFRQCNFDVYHETKSGDSEDLKDNKNYFFLIFLPLSFFYSSVNSWFELVLLTTYYTNCK